MLTQKLLSRTVALAMTASVALLSGCPTAGVTPDPNATVTPSNGATVSPMPTDSASVAPTASGASVAPTASGASVAPTTSGSASGSATPSANQSTQPSGNTGDTPDIRERATFNGKVYDRNGVPVDGATVVAKSLETGVTFQGESQQTTGGAYVFRNAPVGTRVEVTVSKPGWTTRTQTIVLKSNLNGDPNANVLNFGTDGTSTNGNQTGSVVYAIQDEPEVTMLKINDRMVGSAFATDRINSSNTFSNSNGTSALLNVTPNNLGTGNNVLPGNTTAGNASNPGGVGLLDDVLDPSLTGVASNTLKVEVTFSEPVNKEDVEQNFRIRSQNYTATNRTPSSTTVNTKSFVISNQTLTSDDITYTWSADSTMLTIQSKKGILANSDNATDEFRYLVDFQNGFKDTSNKKARSSSAFRFGPSQVNDFAIFSVTDDEEDPRLVSAVARDGSTSDVIELQFSEDMEVISQTSPASRLSDTITNTNNNFLSFFHVADGSATDAGNVNGNNGFSSNTIFPVTSTINGATVLAFNDPTEAANGPVATPVIPTNPNRYSYMIGKILSQQISNITSAPTDTQVTPVGNLLSQANEVANVRTVPLGFTGNTAQDNSGTVVTAPATNAPFGSANAGFGGTTTQGTSGAAIREIRVRGKIVTIDLDQTAFQSGDRVVVAAGGSISGNFVYQNNTKSISVTPGTITNRSNGTFTGTVTNARFRDPAGNEIDRGNSSTINNITATNAQKNSSVN